MVDKDKLIEDLKELIEMGEIKATWEGIIVDIKNITVKENGTIILDVNEY